MKTLKKKSLEIEAHSTYLSISCVSEQERHGSLDPISSIQTLLVGRFVMCDRNDPSEFVGIYLVLLLPFLQGSYCDVDVFVRV